MPSRITTPELWLFSLVMLFLSAAVNALYVKAFAFAPPAPDRPASTPTIPVPLSRHIRPTYPALPHRYRTHLRRPKRTRFTAIGATPSHARLRSVWTSPDSERQPTVLTWGPAESTRIRARDEVSTDLEHGPTATRRRGSAEPLVRRAFPASPRRRPGSASARP